MRTRQGEPAFVLNRFVIDTGADVTMIPLLFARQHRLQGYDEAAVPTSFDTSFGGVLEGKWGSVELRIGTAEFALPCFYRVDTPLRLPQDRAERGWYRRFTSAARRAVGFGSTPVLGPFVLGLAGGLGMTLDVVLEGGAVCLGDGRGM